jgi:hypothetical protein
MKKKPINELVERYREVRDAIKEREQEIKEELASMREEMDEVGGELLDFCNEQGLDSIKTPAGTVSRRVNTRYWTNDWESMYEFVEEHDSFYLLEKRLHNANMKQFLEENPDLHPKGLQIDNKYIVQVRKPT